jgi:hypothetical protein
MPSVRVDYMDGRTEVIYGEPQVKDDVLVITERHAGGGVKRYVSIPLANVRKWQTA